jgi:RHS repeat-associated protein
MVYDDWRLIAEYSGSAPVCEYIHGPFMDEVLARADATNTVYYSGDALNSTAALTDGSGTVVERYRYTAFGQPTILDSSLSIHAASVYGNRFVFQGREWFSELNLTDHRNRYSSPELDRWLNRDLIEEEGGFNLYQLINNQPINFIDSLGFRGGLVPNPNWPPITGPFPPRKPFVPPGVGGNGAAALLFALIQTKINSQYKDCQSPCLTKADCTSCCNTTTYLGIAANAGAGITSVIACAAWVMPWKVGVCIAATAYIQQSADAAFLDSQSDCLDKCNKKSK